MNTELVLQLLANKTNEIKDILLYMQGNKEQISNDLPMLLQRIEALRVEAKQLQNNTNIAHEKEEIAVSVKAEPTEMVVVEKIVVEEENSEEKYQQQEENKPVFEEKNQQEEIILNEKLQNTKAEVLGDAIRYQKHSNIQSAIGINDRFLFVRELFNNNADAYANTIDFINKATTFTEVEQYLQKNNWDNENDTVVQFLEIAKRKF